MALKVTEAAVLAALRSESEDGDTRELDDYALWAQNDARRALEAALPHLVDAAEPVSALLAGALQETRPSDYELWRDALLISATASLVDAPEDVIEHAGAYLEALRGNLP